MVVWVIVLCEYFVGVWFVCGVEGLGCDGLVGLYVWYCV